VSLVSMLKKNGPNGLGYGSTAEEVTAGMDLKGRTILITGCNSGLGAEAMRVLCLRGAQVIGTARSDEKAREACAAVKGETVPLACELSDPKSVAACVAAVKSKGLKLDAIICNAGIMALPKLEKSCGVERQFFTNHMGHFLLVTGLLGELKEDGRVVMLSSSAHKGAPRGAIQFDNLDGAKGYSDWSAYGQSKMANLLFAKELARRFAGTRKTAFGVHPGVINTNLTRHLNALAAGGWAMMAPLFLKTVEQGAATEVYAAVHPDAVKHSGAYLADCNVARPRRDAEDPALATRLWEASEKIVASLPS